MSVKDQHVIRWPLKAKNKKKNVVPYINGYPSQAGLLSAVVGPPHSNVKSQSNVNFSTITNFKLINHP